MCITPSTGNINNASFNIKSNNPPYEPSNPIPPDGATNVSIYTSLCWTGGDPDGDLVIYDVYFGKNYPPNLIINNQSLNCTYSYAELEFNTKYFWKIVAWDPDGSTEGPIWSFTTIESPHNTLYVGGTGEGNYTTIQDAIKNASDGDTVFVYDDSSPYYENVIINKSINLIGEDRNTTIIDGSFIDYSIKIKSSYVSINNFTLQKGKYNTISAHHDYLLEGIHISQCNILNSDAGIFFQNISKSTIEYCYCYKFNGPGITMYNPSNEIWIGQCEIDSCKYGILVKDSNISIVNCRISNNTYDGILVHQKSKNIRIFRNKIRSNNYTGITVIESGYSGESSNITIEKNLIEDNGQGANYNTGIYLQDCLHSVVIKYNNISNNNLNGIYLMRSNEILIIQNIIHNKYAGIFLWNSNSNTIMGNTISNHSRYGGIGLFLECDSSSNTILKNNFIGNGQDAFFITRLKNILFKRNRWEYNYWNRPQILPKLIFGKIGIGPIESPWINIDWFPAKEPYDIEVVI